MTHASRGWKRIASSAAVVAIAGCGVFNPYEHAALEEPPHPAGLRLAGDADDGLRYAEEFRAKYFRDLSSAAAFRNVTGVALIGLSGWAVYNGLKPEGGTTGDVRRGTRLGAAAASVYALRQFLVNPGQEQAYAEGYRALTCLMLQSAPLLTTEAEDRSTVAAFAWPIANSPGVRASSYASPAATDKGVPVPFPLAAPGELDRFRIALDRLEAKIQYVNVQLAEVRGRASAMPEIQSDLDDPKSSIRRQFTSTAKALLYARNALSDGRLLLRTYENAGHDIKGRASIIVAAVNEQIQSRQLDLGGVTDLLKNAQDITNQVMNIGGATAVDQIDVTTPPEDSASLNLRGGGFRATGPMLMAGSVATAYFTAQISSVVYRTANIPSATVDETQVVAVAAAASDTSVTASPATGRAAGSEPASKPKPAAKPTKPAKAAARKTQVDTAPVTTGELKAIRLRLDEAIKKAEADDLAKKQKQEAAAKAKDIEEWSKRVQTLKEQLKEKHLRCDADPNSGGCITHLAKETENLYAARRPVVHEVLAFRAKTRAVALTPECVELAVLRVAPNDVIRAHPGETVSFIVSQRAAGSPLAVMQGSTDPKTGVTFNFLAQQGTSHYVAKMELGKDMPKQTIRLVVSDSKSVVTQNLSVAVGDPLPPQRVDLPTAAKNAVAAAAGAQAAAEAAAGAAKAVSKAASEAAGRDAASK